MFDSWFPRYRSTASRLMWLHRAAVTNVYTTLTDSIVRFMATKAKPVKSLSVSLEPIQDLHGYDNPWPGGGGVNKFNIAWLSRTTYKNVTVTPTTTGVAVSGTASGTSGFAFGEFSLPVGSYYFKSESTGLALQLLNQSYSQLATGKGTFTVSDATAIYRFRIMLTENTTYDFVINNIQIVVGSTEPTTYSPYSNLCPISGRTGATVWRTGKNLLPNKTVARTSSSIFIGQDTASEYPVHLFANQTYALSFTANGTDPSANYRESGGSNTFWGVSGATFTPSRDMDIQIWVYAPGITEVSDFQLELSSTATDYVPYSGTSIPITFPTPPGTVYGGTVDVTTGKVRVTYLCINLGNSNWNYDSTNRRFVIASPLTNAKVTNDNTAINGLCSMFQIESVNKTKNANYDHIVGVATNGYVCIKETSYTDPTAFKASLSGQTLVYELAEPVEYTLTAAQLTTLLGENNVWSDAGEVTVTASNITPIGESSLSSLNILLGGSYTRNAGEPTDAEALSILTGGTR